MDGPTASAAAAARVAAPTGATTGSAAGARAVSGAGAAAPALDAAVKLRETEAQLERLRRELQAKEAAARAKKARGRPFACCTQFVEGQYRVLARMRQGFR